MGRGGFGHHMSGPVPFDWTGSRVQRRNFFNDLSLWGRRNSQSFSLFLQQTFVKGLNFFKILNTLPNFPPPELSFAKCLRELLNYFSRNLNTLPSWFVLFWYWTLSYQSEILTAYRKLCYLQAVKISDW